MIYPYRKMPRFDEGLDFMAQDEYYEPSLEERVMQKAAANLRIPQQEAEYAAMQDMQNAYDDSVINNYIDKMMSKSIEKPVIRRRSYGSDSGRRVVAPVAQSSGSRERIITKNDSTSSPKITLDSILKEMNQAYKQGGIKSAETVYRYHMRKNGTAASAAIGAFNYQRKQESQKRKMSSQKTQNLNSNQTRRNVNNLRSVPGKGDVETRTQGGIQTSYRFSSAFKPKEPFTPKPYKPNKTYGSQYPKVPKGGMTIRNPKKKTNVSQLSSGVKQRMDRAERFRNSSGWGRLFGIY